MRRRIIVVTTIPETMYSTMKELIPFLIERDMEVIGVASRGQWLFESDIRERFHIPYFTVEFTRIISPIRDFIALLQMLFVLFRLRPHIIHYSTPKASLIAAMASFIMRTPLRVYTVRGIPFERKKGLAFRVFLFLERLTCMMSHVVICVSRSNMSYISARKICPPRKLCVIRNGSSHGVDARNMFNPSSVGAERRAALRKNAGISDSAVVFGYIGRLVGDKGAPELLKVWETAAERWPDAHLLIVGDDGEPRDRILMDATSSENARRRLHLFKPTRDIVEWYAVMDVFILPSHREGFPNVVLEAGAMGLPVITTDALGCIDSVIDGLTGFIFKYGDCEGLIEKMTVLYKDRQLRDRLGSEGRRRALSEFDPQLICEDLFGVYTRP
jgi:glycosyltransferase involved in cell wall biosynthesis